MLEDYQGLVALFLDPFAVLLLHNPIELEFSLPLLDLSLLVLTFDLPAIIGRIF